MKKSNWVLFVTNGIMAILFGLMMLLVTEGTIYSIVRVFGVVVVIGGLVMLNSSFQNKKTRKSYLLLMAEAIFAIIIGAIIAINPGKSLNLFLVLVGIWALVMGLLQIIVAVQMRKKVSNHSMFTLNGIITLVFGLLLFYHPMGTAKALVIVIGLLAVVAGLVMVYLGGKVRSIKE
jgi:uncharacterized membrane protein HdeD (DUF308 family)